MTDLTTGQRIAQCRKALALSQEALGEKLGVSRQAISKWEADAALPEIDKLIILSRLFGVSVGWLLGVEELPEPQPESPPISEELLRKIEEVVQRYQPQKKPFPLWKKLVLGAAALVLLWGGVKLRSQWQSMDARLSQLSSRINDSRNSNAAVLNQLEDLQAYINNLSSAPERFSISDYSFEIEPELENTQAQVVISAIPGTWNEAFTAAITVRREGQQVESQTLAWDGTGFTARLLLPLENGYEYWFTVQYPDGTREQVQLFHSAAENLKRSFTISCHISPGKGYFSLKNNILTLEGCVIGLAPPSLVAAQDIGWTAELTLYHIRDGQRQIADTEVLIDPETLSTTEEGTGIQILESTLYPKGPFQLPELEDGDSLELWVVAQMENGISMEQMVNCWIYLDGEFLEGTPAAPLE